MRATYKSIIAIVLLGLLVSFVPFSVAPATAQDAIFFEEQFDTLDPNRWEVNDNSYPVPVSVSNGFIHMGSPETNSLDFPYVRIRVNPFPTTGDFGLEIGFQYTGVAMNGGGLIMLDSENQGIGMDFWQDSELTGGLSISAVGNLGIDTNYHVLKYVVQGSSVTAFLDGDEKQSFSLAARPTQLWFGHPTIGQVFMVGFHPDLVSVTGVVTGRWWGAGDWTSFKLDFIRITSLPTLSEEYSTESTLTETIHRQKVNLTNVIVSGDFESTLNFTNFEMVTISTGTFAGQGFSKGEFETTLESVSYQGNWQGVAFLNTEERRIYLKGSTSGGIRATVEGYLTESVPESGVYDQYQAIWKIGRLGSTTTSATISLTGNLSYQESSEFPSTKIYVLQTFMEGPISGNYSGTLSTVLTHLRVSDEINPYNGQGFSIISYVSETGSGEGWTYDNIISPGKVELRGLFTSPLFGTVYGEMDESTVPRTLFLNVTRIDLGLPPAPDLKVRVWGPERVSPGQTVNYIIEYRNDGLIAAENIEIRSELSEIIEYVCCSENGMYDWEIHGVMWSLERISAKSISYLSVTAYAPWGLSVGSPLKTYVSIYPVIIQSALPAIQKFSLVNIFSEESQKADYTAWRTGLQKGDILLVHYNGGVPLGYWDHAGIYDGEGYVIEAQKMPGVVQSRIENWDYRSKTDVAIFRVHDATMEQIDKAVAFARGQLGKPYQDWYYYPDKSSSYYSYDWYCSELVWAAYLNQGIDIEANPAFSPVSPQEIAYDNDVYFVSGHGQMQDGSYLPQSDPEYPDDSGTSVFIGQIAVARDPNVKYGPEGSVLPGQKLDYKVEFENEGEGIAFGVYFTDTLDEDLDDSTLAIGPVIDVNTGFQIAPAGIYNPQTRTITWFVGEVGSQQGGYAEFNVNVRNDAPSGTEIINFAIVYFPSVPEVTRTNGIVSFYRQYQTEVKNFYIWE